MAKQNALDRKLVALESLQAVSNVSSDNTSTLTEGKMVMTNIWLPNHESQYIVTRQGYETVCDLSTVHGGVQSPRSGAGCNEFLNSGGVLRSMQHGQYR